MTGADNRGVSRALTEAYIDQFPQEAMDVLEAAPVAEIVQLLRAESVERAARVLSRMSSGLAAEVLLHMKPELARRSLTAMDPGRAAILLSGLDEHSRNAQLEALDSALAQELRELMAYPEGSAGRLMEPRAASMPARLTVRQALGRLRRFSARDVALLVVSDDAGRLAGLLELADVVRADPGQRLAELISFSPARVTALTPREEIVELFAGHDLHPRVGGNAKGFCQRPGLRVDQALLREETVEQRRAPEDPCQLGEVRFRGADDVPVPGKLPHALC